MAKLRLYGVIGDEVDGLTAAAVAARLDEADSSDSLEVRINSAGGLISEGLAIYQMLAQWPGETVIHVDGLAASMASLIAMAGDRIEIAKGAMMMIHNPSNVTMGDAEEHRRTMTALEKMGRQIADIYAERSGQAVARVVEMMAEETWMTAEEAVELGFATVVSGDAKKAQMKAVATAHLRLQNVPEWARSGLSLGAAGVEAACPAEPTREPKMADDIEPAVADTMPAANSAEKAEKQRKQPEMKVDVEAIRRAERERIEAIRRKGVSLRLDETAIAEIISSGVSVGDAAIRMIDLAAAAGDSGKWQGAALPRVELIADNRDKMLAGMENALLVRAGVGALVSANKPLDPGEFRGLTMREMARHCLQAAGINTRNMEPHDLIGKAFTMGSNINQGVGDFAILLENTMHKSMLGAYDTAEKVYSRIVKTTTVPDYRVQNRYRPGSLARTQLVAEFGEIPYRPIPDGEKFTVQADEYGLRLAISRKAIINDDMSFLSDLSVDAGRAAVLSIETDVFGLINENSGLGPTQSDSQPFFHSNRANVGTGAALSVTAISADKAVMMRQTDPSGNHYLALRPRILLVSVENEDAAREINGNEYDPGDNKFRKMNVVRGTFNDVVGSPYITGNRRYLVAAPTQATWIELALLAGYEAPRFETMSGWSTSGAEMRLLHDYGLAMQDPRAAVTNAGSGG